MSLTIHDYIDALSEYLPMQDMNIIEVIDSIEDDETIIPLSTFAAKKSTNTTPPTAVLKQ